MRSKRGDMTTKEILEIVLGGAVVLLLLLLLYNLIMPDFDEGDKTAEAYFESLEKEIGAADSDNVGSFSIWQPSDDGREFFLIYFGNHSSYGESPRKFYSLGNNVNHICVCSWDDGVDVCDYCRNLELPVRYNGDVESWAVGVGSRLKITRAGGYYEFVKI